ncbi:vitamin K epoxide reductase family protein [Serinibacter arcticus]|nr:vitamin K epoxide reductase family protein [Serinibacter arcticus]
MTTTLDGPEAPALVGRRHSRRFLFATMGISAIFCLVASAVLSVESFHLAGNPEAVFGCDVNAALSCGAVARAWQAQVLGFPNAFIGLATEPVVLTIAVAGFAGVRFPRWFMFAAQIGYLLGLVFAFWLFFQSMFVIGSLCPWCLTITVFTTVTFFTMLHINVVENNLPLSRRGQEIALTLVRNNVDVYIPAVIIAAMAIGILLKYGTIFFS